MVHPSVAPGAAAANGPGRPGRGRQHPLDLSPGALPGVRVHLAAFMILPIQAALERLPPSLLQASADLGARPGQTLRLVVLRERLNPFEWEKSYRAEYLAWKGVLEGWGDPIEVAEAIDRSVHNGFALPLTMIGLS